MSLKTVKKELLLGGWCFVDVMMVSKNVEILK
jgi:hypothetical protein